jgi:NADPH:quinone reductase-like Zn-dependent oxidoreductase
MNGHRASPEAAPHFRVRSFDAVADPEEFAKLNRHLNGRRVRVPIAATYPLARAADPHRRLDGGHVLGRIALRIGRRRIHGSAK